MKKNIILLTFSLIFFTKSAFSQAHHSAVSVKLLFASDKHLLTAAHIAQLDSAWRIVEKLPITSVVIDGNTDSDGSEKYNEKLSKRRSEALKTYLATKNIEDFMLKTDFWGETRPADDNATNKGKRENRRVEVFFFYSTPPPLAQNPVKSVEKQVVKPDPIAAIPPETPKKETPKEPTIFYNKKIEDLPCKVESDPGCSQFEVTGDSAVLSELSSFKTFCSCKVMAINQIFTYANNGAPLISGSMFEFATKNGKCLAKPIDIFIPFKEYDKDMTLWDIDEKGNWKPSPDPLAVVYKNGQGYWKITTSCGGKKNMDKFIQYEEITVAINSQQGSQLSSVQAYYSTGNLAGFYGKKDLKQKSVEFGVPYNCENNSLEKIQLYVIAKNKKGESFILKDKTTAKYAYPLATRTFVKATRGLRAEGGAKKLVYKLFGIFPIYEKGNKWLYILEEKDFEKQPNSNLGISENKANTGS